MLIHVCSARRQICRILKCYIPSGLWVKWRLWNTHLIATAALCTFLHSNTRIYFSSYFSSFYLHSLHSLLKQHKLKAFSEKWLSAVFQRRMRCLLHPTGLQQIRILQRISRGKIFWLKKMLQTLIGQHRIICSWNLPKMFSSNFTQPLCYLIYPTISFNSCIQFLIRCTIWKFLHAYWSIGRDLQMPQR